MPQDYYTIKSLPVSVAPIQFSAASLWCRDIQTADQALVESLISSAVDFLQDATNRIFLKTQFTGKYSGIAVSMFEPYKFVELRKSPLIAVDEVRVNGDVLSPANYKLKEESGYARLWFFDSLDLDDKISRPIEVDFTVGYGNEETLTISAITRVGYTVTVKTSSSHHLVSGAVVKIAGAAQSAYNGLKLITVTAADEFTYSVDSEPATPATGTTITAIWPVEEGIKTMVEQLVLFWYENRGDISTDAKQQIPFTTKQLIKKYRIVDVY